MNDILPLNNGLPSLCSVYGHNFRTTNKPGRFKCSNCKLIGYCSDCLLATPEGVYLMQCKAHTPQSQEVKS